MMTTTWQPATRREFLQYVGLSAAAMTLPQTRPSSAPAPSAARPNVLVILADDLGYSDLACYGGEIPTPNIDALAAGGLKFTQVYNAARCCPSRASLVTGLYPHQTGIGSFVTPEPDPERGPAYLGHLNDQCVTFAQVLKPAGYQTYMVGKWHMGAPGPIEHGFDEFYGFTRGYAQDQWSPEVYERLPSGRKPELQYPAGQFYATDAFSDYALEFLRQARQDERRPWLLYLAYSSPHFPLQAPSAARSAFVETYRHGWDLLREQRFARQKQLGLATDAWTLPPRDLVPLGDEEKTAGYAGQQNPAWEDLPADRREDLARRMAIFAAMVGRIDDGVGRIVAYLRQTGQLDNTLILLLSDNGACYEWGPFGFDGPRQHVPKTPHVGEALDGMGGPGTYLSYGSAWANLSNTPLRMYKHYDHEGGICTPMVVHWPRGIRDGHHWVREPTHIMDIMPTLCEVGGASYPEQLGGHAITPVEGMSLVPVLRGGVLPERPLFFEHQGARAMRQGRWKIVWSKYEPREITWELYDLATDRCETHDLAAKYPERTRAMAEAWLAWARRVQVYIEKP
jgi:arylsulfatase A-like enzyme